MRTKKQQQDKNQPRQTTEKETKHTQPAKRERRKASDVLGRSNTLATCGRAGKGRNGEKGERKKNVWRSVSRNVLGVSKSCSPNYSMCCPSGL